MSNILKQGQVVRAELAGLPCVVDSFLGSGGQGEVFRARLSNSVLALKWYNSDSATPQQRAAVELLIRKGPPSELFLWPMDLASSPDMPDFGYLMPLRPTRFRSGYDLVKRSIEPSFRAIITSALHLAQGFLQLHANGLAYRDISFGNLFLDPDTGDTLICDNDNVGIDGQPHNDIGGTMRFMAPEIVRGEAAPSTRTDQFSLAVLLHFMLYMDHPLEGKGEAAIRCLGSADQLRLYGTEPIYVADPKNDANRPVRGRHDNILAFWHIYPASVRTLFARAFTTGLHDPSERVSESEWRAALAQLRDSIVLCTCEAENFFDPRRSRAHTCWDCKSPLNLLMTLHIGKLFVMLNHDTRLYPHHLDEKRRYDFSQTQAEVTRHPTNLDIWGLRNLSKVKWVATNAAGRVDDVPPGRSITLEPGTRLNFGATVGEIRYTEAKH